jgi:hypothetical protein
MGDAGERLIDAEDRFRERVADREQERRVARVAVVDADRQRTLKSLRLAKAEMQSQAASTQHPVRQQQIRQAIADLDRRMSEV